MEKGGFLCLWQGTVYVLKLDFESFPFLGISREREDRRFAVVVAVVSWITAGLDFMIPSLHVCMHACLR